MIQSTAIHIQRLRALGIWTVSEVNLGLQELHEIQTDMDSEANVHRLQSLVRNFGTHWMQDLMFWSPLRPLFAAIHPAHQAKWDLICQYFHPTGYQQASKRFKIPLGVGPLVKPTFNDSKSNAVCFKCLDIVDSAAIRNPFHQKVFGMRVYLRMGSVAYVVSGLLDEVLLDELLNTNLFLKGKRDILKERMAAAAAAAITEDAFLDSLGLKEYLVLELEEIEALHVQHQQSLAQMGEQPISALVQQFGVANLFEKRRYIVSLLARSHTHPDNAYLAYLLYDLLCVNSNSGTNTNTNPESFADSAEQEALYHSLPWKFKLHFRDAIRKTLEFAGSIQTLSVDRIPLEQQICLLRTTDSVKEKAIQKLKEIKSKSEDTGTKARQYLEGLLKIPFGLVRKEPILTYMGLIRQQFGSIHDLLQQKEQLSLLASRKHSKKELREQLFPATVPLNQVTALFKAKQEQVDTAFQQWQAIQSYVGSMSTIMDKAVHGHVKAKRQIERIIGQWINGTSSGYCFGFEGPPGVGKTSLAKKGLADCLLDAEGRSRPFAMIQMGGDSNGSSLHGHNYTYVGSTWGSIVQILMDAKCMNPIIFIDEVDKISKTEHGREIVGILTHLLDPAQNDSFQDKYFTGIDLDLSKVLFILSYNNAEAIDKILLDRVHRVQFHHLTMDEKVVIAQRYLLPDIMEKMGLVDANTAPVFSEAVLEHIIGEYTLEPGVRKLKELLFEIVGEINLSMLSRTQKISNTNHITIEDLQTLYLADKPKQRIRLISTMPLVGHVNGMYATDLGNGGTLPIHAKFFPAPHFLDLKLTGLQQEVMKESMHVALTVAWDSTPLEVQEAIQRAHGGHGINIHTGDGAVQKDGPSGGCAVGCAIYSLLNDKPVNPLFGITGELQLNGAITAIGGLSSKILGSIKSGVTRFIYPQENERDFQEFFDKHGPNLPPGVTFHPVSHITQAFELVFV